MNSAQKKKWALSLYMQGELLESILTTVGIGSDNTLRKWIREGKWEEQRAAKMLTREELVNGLLLSAKAIIQKALESDEYGNIADSLIKITSSIEKLEPNSVIDSIGVFSEFVKWLQHRRGSDSELTMELIKKINHYQNSYIKEKL